MRSWDRELCLFSLGAQNDALFVISTDDPNILSQVQEVLSASMWSSEDERGPARMNEFCRRVNFRASCGIFLIVVIMQHARFFWVFNLVMMQRSRWVYIASIMQRTRVFCGFHPDVS